mmetsp:Transcript_35901/g.83821  ORF Transcript_35901/g.83821 Transcript_35901/m.83821 type:complete len:157 (-) Transcript_35901:1092-1562(-)
MNELYDLRAGERPSDSTIVNNIFRAYGHQWIYDFDELALAAKRAGAPDGAVCRSDRLGRGLPLPLHRAVRRAREPPSGNASLSCWLDQLVREDESLYVHIHKPVHPGQGSQRSLSQAWKDARGGQRNQPLPRPFCAHVEGWSPCAPFWDDDSLIPN